MMNLEDKTLELIKQESALAWAQMSGIQLPGGVFSVVDHPYQIDWLNENHPDQNFKKGAQIGCTEVNILKTMHGLKTSRLPAGALYAFPSQDDVTDFSKARLNPLIDNNPNEIGRFVHSTDAVNIKRINKAMLYLRGARSRTKLKSIPVDRIVFDEKDEMSPNMITLALERVAHSNIKEVVSLSTPTIPDFGIDKDYQNSDQRIWEIRCKACNTYTCLELEFPNCIQEKKDGTAIRVCKKCKAEIYPKDGRWVPQYPDNKDKVGWWISQLNSLYVDPGSILKAFNNPPNGDLTEVYNSKLGMAWIAAENRLTINQVYACCQAEAMDVRYDGTTGMGVDVGKNLHVVIGSIPFRKGIKIRKIACLTSFSDVYDLSKRFGVKFAVFDLYPETRKVRAFRATADYPVFGCAYSEHQKGAWAWNEKDGVVTVNRTEICDATHELVDTTGRLELPRKDAEVEEYAKEMCNIAKVLQEDDETGSKVYRYRKLGADHYRHATNYLYLAAERLPKRASVVGRVRPGKYIYD